jgi:hypothetical protein
LVLGISGFYLCLFDNRRPHGYFEPWKSKLNSLIIK